MTESDVLLSELIVEIREPRPISVNKLYSDSATRRFLTTEGKAFKDALTSVVSRATMIHKPKWKDVVGAIYKQGARVDLTLKLWLEDVYNPAWEVGGGTTDGGNLRCPYKKKDLDSYLKLISDSVVKGTGIDDACNLDLHLSKREDKLDPRIVVIHRVYE